MAIWNNKKKKSKFTRKEPVDNKEELRIEQEAEDHLNRELMFFSKNMKDNSPNKEMFESDKVQADLMKEFERNAASYVVAKNTPNIRPREELGIETLPSDLQKLKHNLLESNPYTFGDSVVTTEQNGEGNNSPLHLGGVPVRKGLMEQINNLNINHFAPLTNQSLNQSLSLLGGSSSSNGSNYFGSSTTGTQQKIKSLIISVDRYGVINLSGEVLPKNHKNLDGDIFIDNKEEIKETKAVIKNMKESIKTLNNALSILESDDNAEIEKHKRRKLG
ncbi:hypothetical protein [Clostridium sp.]|jgi:hypothetical protein|uniref:hypothetical protein n=1 Tax=Clostridium sp. TaxID=1506 RepID=UPI003EF00083